MKNLHFLTQAEINGQLLNFMWNKASSRIIASDEFMGHNVGWQGGYEESVADSFDSAMSKVNHLIEHIRKTHKVSFD